jgi:hypothetical protein
LVYGEGKSSLAGIKKTLRGKNYEILISLKGKKGKCVDSDDLFLILTTRWCCQIIKVDLLLANGEWTPELL